MKILRLLIAPALVLALVAPAYATDQGKSEGKNVTQIDDVKFDGGTELAASGDFVYAGELNGRDNRNQDTEKGGVHIFDVSSGKPKEVGFFHCPGNDNDVEVVRPGLVAVGHHTATCNAPDSGEATAGLYLLDVRNPKKPVQLGSVNLPSGMQSHTIKPYPGKDIVYVNPGGLPSNGRMASHIVDVSNPAKPKILASYTPPVGPTGCHDFSFHISKKAKLGFCAGYAGFQVWDVSDPAAPEFVSREYNPQIQFNHYAVPSTDGKLLAIDDEAFAAHECRTGNSPTGRVWIYDISDPTDPKVASSFAPPRGGDSIGFGHYVGWVPSWCLSHGLDWYPGHPLLAVTWFTGGFSLIDAHDPTEPKEVGWFRAEDSATYSALWHKGLLYTNDMWRGLDAFKVKLSF